METIIRKPETDLEWEAYYDLRYRILRAPLNQPRGSEKNEGDATGIHFALFENAVLKAIARLDTSGEHIGQVRFVAVEGNQQGKGYGKQIMNAVEEFSRERGDQKMILHARDYAIDFYKRLDYQLLEKSHLLFGVLQHYLMEKEY